MVTKQDIAELKRRMDKPENCNIIRMKGCYVNSEKAIVTKINQRFMNLPDEEIFKYLDIAKAPYQPAEVEDKVLTLEFDEGAAGIKETLSALVESELKDEIAEQALYEKIIEDYSYAGNYLILLFVDTYDIPKRTKDGKGVDESEEVYQHIICTICPVSLQKTALQYEKSKNIFQCLEREWIVGKPMNAFVYPAFDNRSADEDEIMYYCAEPSFPGHELMECILQCKHSYTATEHREMFEGKIAEVTESKEIKERYLMILNAEFEKLMLDESVNCHEMPKRLSAAELSALMKSCEITDIVAAVTGSYERRYEGREWPKVAWLFNKAYRKAYYAKKARERERDLLQLASSELQNFGQMDLALEIERHLEQTR